MRSPTYEEVARIVGKRGVEGGLLVRSGTFSLPSLMACKHFFLRTNEVQFFPYFVLRWLSSDTHTALVWLEDITNPTLAQALVGKSIWLPTHTLPTPTSSFVGYEILDGDTQSLGIIENIFYHPLPIAQIFIQKKEVLLPIDKEHILKLDKDAKRIHLRIAKGLLDTYLG